MDRKQEDADINQYRKIPDIFGIFLRNVKLRMYAGTLSMPTVPMCVMYRKKCSPTRLSVWL